MNAKTPALRLAAVGAAAAVALPVVALVAAPANAAYDIEKQKRCGDARIELSVDREAGGFEVNADVDNATAGSRWRIVLRHDGTQVAKVNRRADNEGDVEVERWRRNTQGSDTFKMRAKNRDTGRVCTLKITTR